MSKIDFRKVETEKRKEKLNKYYKCHFENCENGCDKFSGCKSAFGVDENSCTDSFKDSIRVGKYYDTYYEKNNGKAPLRILVVGIEGVCKDGQTFAQKNAEDFRLTTTCNNNHIVGTLETLLRIYKSENKVQEHWKKHIEKGNDILYDSFALTNAFKCVFKDKNNLDNKAGPKNRTMFDNCFKHLIKEIKELEPTIIITQGRWSDKYNNLLVEAMKGETKFEFIEKIDKAAAEGYDNLGLYEFKYNNQPMYVLLSLHPARIRWNNKKLNVVLYKQLEYLRSKSVIPNESVLNEYILTHKTTEQSGQ